MWSFLDKLRCQPKERREQYAFVAAFSITAVIGLGWFAAMTLTVSDTTATIESRTGDNQASVLGQFADDAGARFGQLVGQMRSVFSTSSPTTTEVDMVATTTGTESATTTATSSADTRPVRIIQIATTSTTTASSAGRATTTE